MSRLPTIAGTSAIRQPLQRAWVTERFENELDRARTRLSQWQTLVVPVGERVVDLVEGRAGGHVDHLLDRRAAHGGAGERRIDVAGEIVEPDLTALDGDEGARRLIDPATLIRINSNDTGILRDVDTPADLA